MRHKDPRIQGDETIAVRLPFDLAQAVKHAAQQDDRPLSVYLRRIIMQMFPSQVEPSPEISTETVTRGE